MVGDDGRFADVDYTDSGDVGWALFEHLHRVRELARAYARGGEAGVPATCRAAVVAALDWWLVHDPRSRNWWYNELGTPLAVGDTLILLGDDLTESRACRAGPIFARAVWPRMTGQNLLWAAQARIRRGLIGREVALVAEAFTRAQAEIAVTEGEGIQADWSFHQHGPQLYCGGYGHGFARDAVALAALGHGSQFAFGTETLRVLAAFLLDGQQWMIHGDGYDIGCLGRETSRPASHHRAGELAQAMAELATLGGSRHDELAAVAARLRGHPDAAPQAGVRFYPRSDYLAVHRPGWSVGVKMASTRSVPTETGDGEGLRNWHLGDGVSPLWTPGRDQAALMPVWDWRRLPGLTAEQQPGVFPQADYGCDDEGRPVTGGSDIAGGLTAGGVGLATMLVRRNGLTAYKAWFFADDGYAALGAGITAPHARHPVYTTVEQTRAVTPIRYGTRHAGAGRLDTGRVHLSHTRWVHHHDTGCLFPFDTTVDISHVRHAGSWADISRQQSTDPVTADLFTVTIDHQPRPRQRRYAYQVLPGITADQAAAYATRPLFTVAANCSTVQCVHHRHTGLVQAVFHRAGRVTAGGWRIVVDRPVLLQVRPVGGRWEVAVASPDRRAGTVHLRLSARTTARHRVTARLALQVPATGRTHRRCLALDHAASLSVVDSADAEARSGRRR